MHPRLGARGAANLQAELLRRTVQTSLGSGAEVLLWATPNHRHPLFLAARRRGARLKSQPCGDLGRRMLVALREGLRKHDHVTVLGTDCPALRPSHLRALQEGCDMQVIAALDGGYVAIGGTVASARAFRNVSWGRSCVLRQTRRNMRGSSYAFHVFPALPDLDTPEDWRQHRRHKQIHALDCCRRSAC